MISSLFLVAALQMCAPDVAQHPTIERLAEAPVPGMKNWNLRGGIDSLEERSCVAGVRTNKIDMTVLHVFSQGDGPCGPFTANIYCFVDTPEFQQSALSDVEADCYQPVVFDGCSSF